MQSGTPGIGHAVRALIWAGAFWAAAGSVAARESDVRIYVVGHGWHTGLVIPLTEPVVRTCPGLRRFEGWDFVEIGWGDEGFYRGADSISPGVALKAVFTPTPTVFHVVGVEAPVESFFPLSEMVVIEMKAEQFDAMVEYIGATFQKKNGEPVDLGEGIYGHSRFYRAEGSYYFPNTCNVWTLKALKAGGFSVVPRAGIRTENVMNQSEKLGTKIRRFPGRSRLSVLIAAVVAAALGWRLRKAARLVPLAWVCLVLALVSIAVVTMLGVNQVSLPEWLPGAAAFACWWAAAFAACAHWIALRRRFRRGHLLPLTVFLFVILAGLSPL